MIPKKSGFVALDVARTVVRQIGSILPVVRKHDRDLSVQLQRAANSVILNIEEGRKRIAGDQRRLFEIACGSANEMRAAVGLAETWGWLNLSEELIADMDRLVGLLWGASRRQFPKD